MNSGSINRRAHRGNVDPITGKKIAYYNCRRNTTNGRRYSYQLVYANPPKGASKRELFLYFRSRKPIKTIRHDKYA